MGQEQAAPTALEPVPAVHAFYAQACNPKRSLNPARCRVGVLDASSRFRDQLRATYLRRYSLTKLFWCSPLEVVALPVTTPVEYDYLQVNSTKKQTHLRHRDLPLLSRQHLQKVRH